MKKGWRIWLGTALFISILSITLWFLFGNVYVSFNTSFSDGIVRDGSIILDGKVLGTTDNGVLSVLKKELFPGEITFSFEYLGRVREYTVFLSSEDIDTGRMKISMSPEGLDDITFSFSVREMYDSLEGTVYLNNKKLGTLSKGSLTVPLEEVFPGTITLDNNREIVGSWAFTREDLERFEVNLILSAEQFANVHFDSSTLDEKAIERETLTRINELRMIEGFRTYRLDTRLVADARVKSQELIEQEDFAHTSKNGISVYSRLKSQRIYFIVAGENLYSTSNIPASDTPENISRRSVDGWLESPGHRSVVLDRDNLYSHAGIGVSCAKRRCVITLIVAGLSKKDTLTLQPKYGKFFSLYDKDLGFTYSTRATILLRSTNPVDVYLVPSRNDWDNFIKNDNYEKLEEWRQTTSLDKTVRVSSEEGIILFNSDTSTFNSPEIDIEIKYE